MAASVVIAAVFHSARDSVLIAMVLHATNNAVGGSYASQLFHGADSLRLGLLTAAGWWLLAAAVMVHMIVPESSARPDACCPSAKRWAVSGPASGLSARLGDRQSQ